MEQTIRDAYQIMMNRCIKPGGGVGGKDYIKFRSSPQCSEGDGYGLLGAASMADKETFDGLWLYIHDYTMNKVKRYSDCKESSTGYAYSRLPGWTGAGANSATDGDVDIGLALLTAYLQWGELMGIDDACGEPISYKKEAVEFLKVLTDTLILSASGNYLSGDIGLDGYLKGGDSWTELTDWANDKTRSGLPRIPDAKGPALQHIDFAAPSYFHAFADFLTKENPVLYAWNIKQFQRAEASSDWLIGQMLANEKMIPFAGWVELSSANVPKFSNYSEGNDFRLAWRTIINTMWHGNPLSTWDPVSHQVKSGISNSYEQDIGKRYARFLWDSRQSPWNNPCVQNVGGKKDFFWGPEILKYSYSPEGEPRSVFALNWVPGTGSPSAVVSQNFNLMAELYRSLEIKWDSENQESYLKSIPSYFHEWFRLMGMLTLTGNYPAPTSIKPAANMKVYIDVDKTAAFKDEGVTYKVSYRNYGSLDAQNVIIVDTIDKDFSYVSSTGNGVFNATSSTVTWNISTVLGFKSFTGVTPTTGEMILKVSLTNPAKKQYESKAVVTCSNGTGWTSNEYPNVLSATMKRNFVNSINQPHSDSISEITTLHGGRPGVHFTYHSDTSAVDASHSIAVRLFHDAQEAYIDHGSYRVSYFLYDTINRGLSGQNGATNGWNVTTDIKEGVNAITISHENLVSGSDSHGKWNQRIIVQFSDTVQSNTNPSLATTDYHLNWYRGVPSMVHRGGTTPLRIVCSITASNYNKIKWDDDWSWSPGAYDSEDGSGYPITPDFTDPNPDNKGVLVDRINPKQCDIAAKTINNILVEEWDGYTWRRVFGNSPLQPVKAQNLITNKTKQMSTLQVNNSVLKYSQSSEGPVRIQVIDLKGRVVATLVDTYQKAGKYSVRWNHGEYGSNMYFLRMISANASIVKKVSLVKP